METTAKKYTVTFSDKVFCDWRTRGLIGNINEIGERCVIVKRTKTLCTLTTDEDALNYLISDLSDQIEIIAQNNDGETSMKSTYTRALVKLNAAKG
jgi:hypothetical protein